MKTQNDEKNEIQAFINIGNELVTSGKNKNQGSSMVLDLTDTIYERTKFIEWKYNVEDYLEEKYGKDNRYLKRFDEAVKNSTIRDVESGIGILNALSSIKKQENFIVPKTKETVIEEELIDISILGNAPFYITRFVEEANKCYQYGCYNGCAVLLRKVIENLIIDSFEIHKRENEIRDSNGNYLYLSDLIPIFTNAKLFTLTRNANKPLGDIKKIGDLAAHNIKYSATKKDVENIIDSYRFVLEEISVTIY